MRPGPIENVEARIALHHAAGQGEACYIKPSSTDLAHYRILGSGVICPEGRCGSQVIPAKAGESVDSTAPKAFEMDSRFRGNDLCLETDPVPNDATAGSAPYVPYFFTM